MAVLAEFQTLPLDRLHESSLNPRKHFDLVKIQELAASIREKGILTPLLVRPRPLHVGTPTGHYEIGAGHRRYRAAKLAGLAELPAVVRDMPDAEFLELLVIENDQREDVHELDQAEGYKRLMLLDGYDAKRIAERVGRSEKFIYDRIKLLQLTKEAQALFLRHRITAGHAILLARLSATDQERALAEGTFEHEQVHDLFGIDAERQARAARKEDPHADQKPVSVRELGNWIATHVRFEATKADPVLFPAVVEAVAEAPKPLVPITSLYHVPDEARDGKVRTYGPQSWKRADGSKGAKACEYAMPAVVVVGPGRGETFNVCLSSNREKYAAHWAREKAAAVRSAKLRAKGESTRRVDNTYEKAEERRKAEEAKRDALRARFKTALPAVLTAIAAAIDKAPLSKISQVVLDQLTPDRWSQQQIPVKLTDVHQPGKTADSILRHAAFCAVFDSATAYRAPEEIPREGKRWGVDVAAILERVAPARKPEKKAEPAAKAVKKPRRMGAIARPKRKAAKR